MLAGVHFSAQVSQIVQRVEWWRVLGRRTGRVEHVVVVQAERSAMRPISTRQASQPTNRPAPPNQPPNDSHAQCIHTYIHAHTPRHTRAGHYVMTHWNGWAVAQRSKPVNRSKSDWLTGTQPATAPAGSALSSHVGHKRLQARTHAHWETGSVRPSKQRAHGDPQCLADHV